MTMMIPPAATTMMTMTMMMTLAVTTMTTAMMTVTVLAMATVAKHRCRLRPAR